MAKQKYSIIIPENVYRKMSASDIANLKSDCDAVVTNLNKKSMDGVAKGVKKATKSAKKIGRAAGIWWGLK